MRFIAHYIHQKSEKPDYWYTLDANDIFEAKKLADKRTRKGFTCVLLKQKGNFYD